MCYYIKQVQEVYVKFPDCSVKTFVILMTFFEPLFFLAHTLYLYNDYIALMSCR